MPSINKAQASLGKNFDVGGTAKTGAIELNSVEEVMLGAANQFMKLAIARINQKKKVDRGNLSDMEVSAITQDGTKYSLTIGYNKNNPASEYYDFQNKGVKGIKSKQPSKSPYSYRTLSVSSKMVTALMQWYMRHKNYIRNEDQRKNLSPLQQKRKTLGNITNQQKKLKQIATNTAKAIKKRGMPRIGFFEDNLDKAFGKDFQTKLAKALGQDIILNIRQNFGNGNNSK
jgi:hypothetical protein